jgi:hypothetical protein
LTPGSAATVTNTGTPAAAVFNFGIPAGQTGATGPAGAVPEAPTDGQQYGRQNASWTVSPIAHATQHLDNGTDPIPVATTARTGAAPKLSGTVTTFLNGTGAYTTPSGVTPSAHATTHNLGGSDAIAPDWTQVQNKPAVPAPSSTSPAMDGAAAVGTGTTYARSDHVHPSDTSRMAVGAAPTAHQASHVTGTDQIPLASASTKGFLAQVSGNTTDFVDGTNNCQNLVTAIQATIWSVRLRSWNSVGNCSFSVDQRTAGAGLTLGAAVGFVQDRWQGLNNLATGRATAVPTYGNVALPGTSSFYITDRFLRFTLTTAQASLAAGELLQIYQAVEGPMLRELLGDVHSISLLVRSSVAGLKFGCALRDAAATRSLCKLCTIPSANVWTLITLPNLALWDAGATWNVQPGNQGYYLSITLAAGATYIPAANDVWQGGNFVGATGQSNFAANTVNSTWDIAFCQHEPGALATTLMDAPFSQNLSACERYFQKTYSYATKPGTATFTGTIGTIIPASNIGLVLPGTAGFRPRMAKSPTVTCYSETTGTANAVRDITSAGDRAVSAVQNDESGIMQIGLTANGVANNFIRYQYQADTGW